MAIKTTTEILTELKRAALQVAACCERAERMTQLSQRAEAMREVSAVLIDMRRNADEVAQRLR